MNASLILSYGSYNVTLNRFMEKGCKQTFESAGDVAYSINGTPIDSGIQYEAPRVYNLEAIVNYPDYMELQYLCLAADKARALWTANANYAIVLEDFINHYSEPGNTQTRALATGGALTVQSNGLTYPAKFKVRIIDHSFEMLRQTRSLYKAIITLKETDRMLP
jgi:hypothetical protein